MEKDSKMQCRICGNQKDNELYKAKEMMFGLRDEFTYFQCSICACLQIAEIPADMTRYYKSDYYSYSSVTKDKCGKEKIVRSILKKYRDNYAIFNNNYLGKLLYSRFPNTRLRDSIVFHFPGEDAKNILSKKTRILDVGCGTGGFLHLLAESGVKNVRGIDPYLLNDIVYGNGLKILKRKIHELDDEFDLIMFHHSFEHMDNPFETLRSTYRLLSRNGMCLIRLPIINSFAWQKYRQNWVQLDAPRHFILHSIKSMEILCDKTNFVLNKIAYDSTEFQFWGSEQYLKDIPLTSDKSYGHDEKDTIFTKEDIEQFKKKAQQLNQMNYGDQAAFYLKKYL